MDESNVKHLAEHTGDNTLWEPATMLEVLAKRIRDGTEKAEQALVITVHHDGENYHIKWFRAKMDLMELVYAIEVTKIELLG